MASVYQTNSARYDFLREVFLILTVAALSGVIGYSLMPRASSNTCVISSKGEASLAVPVSAGE